MNLGKRQHAVTNFLFNKLKELLIRNQKSDTTFKTFFDYSLYSTSVYFHFDVNKIFNFHKEFKQPCFRVNHQEST